MTRISASVLAALLFCTAAAFGQSETSRHTFTVSGKRFQMDGRPYQIISGEMHYPRVPRAYWRDRFDKARAMGLNTITTYVFWNLHEPRPGVYDFRGQNDIAEYIREAQQAGLNVILRPGPYVCAEWELGGYPSWLLKDHGLVLRSRDPKYTAAVERWFARLGKEIAPLLLRNGGPIIAVQVENEYGSFGDDHAYMEALKTLLQKTGMAPDLLYTADGPEEIPKGSLPELPAVINFGTGEAKQSFAELDTMRPDGPHMSGEYWAGWFDHWGEKHHETDGAKEAAELEWMLREGYSVSMYMFHGGTSFGWMNGANSNGSNYEPDTTSYDYDAPLDEQGTPRQKYYLFRDAIAKVTGHAAPPVPAAIPLKTFDIAVENGLASLWRNLPKPVESDTLLTMEDMDQSYGYVLYRTRLEPGEGGELVLDGLHDYAQVYVDQKLAGTLDRRLGTSKLTLPSVDHATTLDILVENTGRVNFTTVIRGERKGLTGTVTLGGNEPKHWQIFSLPMDDVARLQFTSSSCEGPCFRRMQLTASDAADTYLDTTGLHKGEVWVNQQPLGRFWSIGPQHTLYLPAPWLKKGTNEVIVFDSLSDSSESVRTSSKPKFDRSPARSE
ncbi:MAG TPA: beta-galactosidase family protein [Terracidiphilus sp.]